MDYVVYIAGAVALSYGVYRTFHTIFAQSRRLQRTIAKRIDGFKLLKLLVQSQQDDAKRVEEFLQHARELRSSVQSFADRFNNPDRVIEALREMPWREVEQRVEEITHILKDINQSTQNFNRTCEYAISLINRRGNFATQTAEKKANEDAATNTTKMGSAATVVESSDTEFQDGVLYYCRMPNSNGYTPATGAQIKQMIRSGRKLGRDFYVAGPVSDFS